MKDSSFNILLVLLLFFTACYEPEENFVQIDPTHKAKITGYSVNARGINLHDLPDTITIFAPATNFSFDFELSNSRFSRVGVFVNDYLISQIDWLSGEFKIISSRFGEGYHLLNLVVVSNSSTGSLADLIGSETSFFGISKVLNIVRSVPKPLPLNAYAEDGRLKIEWENGDALTAKKIIVDYPITSYYSARWEYDITDPDQTFVIDSLYVGGEFNIRLINLATVPHEDPSAESTLTVNYELPQPYQHSTYLNQVVVTWNRSALYNNIKYHKLTDQNIVSNQNTEYIKLPQDTILVVEKVMFSGSIVLNFETYMNSNQLYQNSHRFESKFVRGSIGEVAEYNMISFVHAPGSPANGFNTDEDKVIQVLNEDQPVLEIPFVSWSQIIKRDLVISYHGEYLYFQYGNILYRAGRTGEVTEVFNIEELIGRRIDMDVPSLGADRYFYFIDPVLVDGYKTGFMYDLKENKILYSRSFEFYQNILKTLQTPDGSYLVEHMNNGVLVSHLIDGMVESTETFSGSYRDIFIDYAHDNRIILIEHTGKITLYDPVLKTLEYQQIGMSVDNKDYYLSYDPVTGYIGIPGSRYLYVINPRSGEVLRSIYVSSLIYLNVYNGILYQGKNRLDLDL